MNKSPLHSIRRGSGKSIVDCMNFHHCGVDLNGIVCEFYNGEHLEKLSFQETYPS